MIEFIKLIDRVDKIYIFLKKKYIYVYCSSKSKTPMTDLRHDGKNSQWKDALISNKNNNNNNNTQAQLSTANYYQEATSSEPENTLNHWIMLRSAPIVWTFEGSSGLDFMYRK